jgi:hypothetical protein
MSPFVANMLPLRAEMQRNAALSAVRNRLTNSGYKWDFNHELA